MHLLYHWKGDRYRSDQQFGPFDFTLEQNSPKMLDTKPGESVWAFTRREDGTYVLAAELVVKSVGRSDDPEGADFLLVGDPNRSRYFDVQASPDAEPLIRSLSVAPKADVLGSSFQGHAAVRPIAAEDHAALSDFAQTLPLIPSAAGPSSGSDWTDEELRAATEAYLSMLDDERHGRKYSKADVNRTLREGPLSTRTKGSIEYRMENISAVLHNLGRPFIEGYKPHQNLGARVEQRILGILRDLGYPTTVNLAPTDDPEELRHRIAKLRRTQLVSKPVGNSAPKKSSRTAQSYVRDPAVVAWVLQEAKGTCELCKMPAPFVDRDGLPFLEVHHVRMLADDGPDTVGNAVALCPNCHRKCHHGRDRKQSISALYQQVPRLVR